MTESFERESRTFLENLPSVLLKLSMPTVMVELSSSERDALAYHLFMLRYGENLIDTSMTQGEIDAHFGRLKERLEAAIRLFPDGAFIKLGSRSPKDSFLAYRDRFRVTDANQAVHFMADSERVVDDLSRTVFHGYQPVIAVREWIEIDPSMEFRCFVRDRRLVGASQYNYNEAYPHLKTDADQITKMVLELVADRVVPNLHLNNVVVDVAIIQDKDGNRKPILIELNPFDTITDPCLFKDWQELYELGTCGLPSFRILDPDGSTILDVSCVR